ncbi:MAG: hypothetical protein ABIZ34_09920 [Candidatus Limnocylindrales bacterium]
MCHEFGGPIFAGTYTFGEIIGPVRSDFGWHVILFVDRIDA